MPDATFEETALVRADETPGEESVPLKRREAPSQQSRTSTYIAVACIAVLVALTMLGGMLNVGDHLMGAHPVLGWVFYGLLAVLVVVGVVVPLFKVAQRPIFSLYQLRDEQGHAKRRWCRKGRGSWCSPSSRRARGPCDHPAMTTCLGSFVANLSSQAPGPLRTRVPL